MDLMVKTCAVITAIDEQFQISSKGVDLAKSSRLILMTRMIKLELEIKELMVGYACDETEELIRCLFSLAHKLTRKTY